MKEFMDADFMLSTPTARHLYHDYAEKMPIVDYHCHINPREIYEDRKFSNNAEVWLGGDHYKWRQMRSNGIDEELITGGAPDKDKFDAYAGTLEKAIGNPLYPWSHLELQRYFDYHKPLSSKTADEVWQLTEEKLAQDDFSVRNLIRRSNVKVICTTDDPADTLEWHKKIAEDPTFDVQVLPAWRPDKAMNVEKPDYADYIAELGEAAGMKIESFADLKNALSKRMDYFESLGCRVSDHAHKYIPYAPASAEEVEAIFRKGLAGEEITDEEERIFKTAFMLFVAKEYADRDWVMQIHYGCKRDNNSFMYKTLGPDTGYDSIDNYAPSVQTADFLDAVNAAGNMPKTVLYSLNPNDNEAITTLIGCFQGDIPGKLQQGSAWWFNDHKNGMLEQMSTLAAHGLLGDFIGMLTDSRSFLSYTRHEYFRRLLCELIGGWVENGEFPNDEDQLKALIEDISFNNANRYFRFDAD